MVSTTTYRVLQYPTSPFSPSVNCYPAETTLQSASVGLQGVNDDLIVSGVIGLSHIGVPPSQPGICGNQCESETMNFAVLLN